MSEKSSSASSDSRQSGTTQKVRGAKRPLGRKLLFAAITTVGFFVLLELTLWALGVDPAPRQDDPFVGFRGGARLFTESENQAGEPMLVTAENRLAWFNHQSFPRDKASNAYRIFCLGGSTTYGRPYDDSASFCGFLRAYLPEMDPSRQWEVINAGGISYASYRIEVLVRELVQYEPDLFVIYTGHNEFLEDRTYQSIKNTPESVQTAIGLARWSRTYWLMQRMLRGKPEKPQERPALPDEVDAILDRAVGPDVYHRDDPWHAQVAANFQSTLERIVGAARDAGAEVIFVVPACNLRDCTPFRSEPRDGLTNEELGEFLAELEAGKAALQDGSPAEALKRLDRAVELDPRRADAQFLRGRALLAAGDWAAARQAFIRAREEDVCPLRALTSLQEIVREVAREQNVPVIDYAAIIDGRSDGGIPGSDWFLDHVHPTLEGNALLAEELANELVEMKVARLQPSWTDDRFEQVAQQVKQQLDPRKHATALRNLAKVLNWAGKVEEADRLALKAAESLSDDAETRRMTGFAKLRQGQIEEAKASFEAALGIDPNDVRALSGLGDVYTILGQHEAARECFARSVALEPKHAPDWFNLGNALRNLGQVKEAEAAYRQALSVAPGQPDVHKNLGLTLYMQGDIEGAAGQFEKAVELEDHVPGRHADFGFALIDAEQPERAEAEFRAALAIDPSFVSAMFGLALLAQRSGDLAKADEMIRKALKIAPDDPNLHFILAQHALQGGDTETAKKELDTVLQLDPNHVDARNLRASMDGR